MAAVGGRTTATVASRTSIGSNWVLPYWEGWQVGRVTRADVAEWVETISTKDHPRLEHPAGAETVKRAHQVLHAAFEEGIRRGHIATNPSRGVPMPMCTPRDHVYLTRAEVRELADAVDPRYRLLVMLLAMTGLRFGEAAALRKRRVKLGERRLKVAEAVTQVEGRFVLGLPRFSKKRDVPFPPSLAPQLIEAMAALGPDDLIFRAPEGGELSLLNWCSRAFKPAIAEVNLRRRPAAAESGTRFHPFPKATPHDLRHTAASIAVQSGANVKVVQRMLGHASASMTLNRYADLFDDDLNLVAERIGAAFDADVDADN